MTLLRKSVIESLQATTKKHAPGRLEHEQADLAISLALSDGREAENAPFLMRNVTRDARRILAHRPRRETTFSVIESAGLAVRVKTRSRPKSTCPASRVTPGPNELLAAELEELVRGAVKALPHGEECFKAMLELEPPEETANRLGGARAPSLPHAGQHPQPARPFCCPDGPSEAVSRHTSVHRAFGGGLGFWRFKPPINARLSTSALSGPLRFSPSSCHFR